MKPTQEIPLLPGHGHIDLCDLLKTSGTSESGAGAKHLIASGAVKVDGVVELRKRCKIRPGQLVESEGTSLKVVEALAVQESEIAPIAAAEEMPVQAVDTDLKPS